MNPKTLAKKIIKAEYGNFLMNPNTHKCMEVCVKNLGKMLYDQYEKHGWSIDQACGHAIDVQLYKIGKKERAKP